MFNFDKKVSFINVSVVNIDLFCPEDLAKVLGYFKCLLKGIKHLRYLREFSKKLTKV